MRTITTFLLAAVVALVALSLTMLASATMLDQTPNLGIRNQIIATLAGFIALGLAASFDYRRTDRLSWIVYGVSIILLLMVLLMTDKINGARRWIFGVQPSEFAKVGLILTLASFGARRQALIQNSWKGLALGCLIALPILVLVGIAPDRGTMGLMLLLTLIILLLAGVRWLYIVPPALVGAAALVTMVVLDPTTLDRVFAWWNPEANKDTSHQVRKSLQAFAVGGLHGQGLGAGAQKFRVPEMRTDFILSAVGEDLGLVGSLGVLGAYAVIMVCGWLIASRAPDLHGLLLAGGITFLICTQAIINIAVVTDLMPNKGMPLPFVSRGGTGITVLLSLVGILLSVARQAGTADLADAEMAQSGRARVRRGQPNPNPFSNPDFAPVE